jgi:hypothetical protein
LRPAYRSASELHDAAWTQPRLLQQGWRHPSEVLLPKDAPERLSDRTTLWNEVEAGEKRKDAQLAREVEFSIREMNEKQGVQLARDFVEGVREARDGRRPQRALGQGEGWQPKPHAHVMLAMREVGQEGSARKSGTGTRPSC